MNPRRGEQTDGGSRATWDDDIRITNISAATHSAEDLATATDLEAGGNNAITVTRTWAVNDGRPLYIGREVDAEQQVQ